MLPAHVSRGPGKGLPWPRSLRIFPSVRNRSVHNLLDAVSPSSRIESCSLRTQNNSLRHGMRGFLPLPLPRSVFFFTAILSYPWYFELAPYYRRCSSVVGLLASISALILSFRVSGNRPEGRVTTSKDLIVLIEQVSPTCVGFRPMDLELERSRTQ